MPVGDRPAGDEPAAERPDTDDYDLLTFGEVAARLADELATATTELDRLRAEPQPDRERIGQLEQRISLLRAAGERYRDEERSSEFFTSRFGSAIEASTGKRPRWS